MTVNININDNLIKTWFPTKREYSFYPFPCANCQCLLNRCNVMQNHHVWQLLYYVHKKTEDFSDYRHLHIWCNDYELPHRREQKYHRRNWRTELKDNSIAGEQKTSVFLVKPSSFCFPPFLLFIALGFLPSNVHVMTKPKLISSYVINNMFTGYFLSYVSL